MSTTENVLWSLRYMGIWRSDVGIVHIGPTAIPRSSRRWNGTILTWWISISATGQLSRWIVSISFSNRKNTNKNQKKENMHCCTMYAVVIPFIHSLLCLNGTWKCFFINTLKYCLFLLFPSSVNRFAIMAYCWALSPLERPTFGQLQVCLQDFYTQITRYV